MQPPKRNRASIRSTTRAKLCFAHFRALGIAVAVQLGFFSHSLSIVPQNPHLYIIQLLILEAICEGMDLALQ